MKELIEALKQYGPRLVGYIVLIAAGLAVADKALVARTLGAEWQDWAILVTAIATIIASHQTPGADKARIAELEKQLSQLTSFSTKE